MPHQTAMQEALNEARRMQADGIQDLQTILAACMVVYASRILEVIEPAQIAQQKRTFRIFLLAAISLTINLIFSLIAATASITYMIDRTN